MATVKETIKSDDCREVEITADHVGVEIIVRDYQNQTGRVSVTWAEFEQIMTLLDEWQPLLAPAAE